MLRSESLKTLRYFLKPALESGVLDKEQHNEVFRILRSEGKPDKPPETAGRLQLLRTREAAEILAVHPKTVLRMADRGDLKKVYLTPGNPKSLRFRLDEVEMLGRGDAA